MHIFALIFEGEAVGKSKTYQSKLSSTYRGKAASENYKDLIQNITSRFGTSSSRVYQFISYNYVKNQLKPALLKINWLPKQMSYCQRYFRMFTLKLYHCKTTSLKKIF